MTKKIIRVCVSCQNNINDCMGFVKAGDWLSEIIPVRELCGRCALIYKWTENEQFVRYNILNEIENT